MATTAAIASIENRFEGEWTATNANYDFYVVSSDEDVKWVIAYSHRNPSKLCFVVDSRRCQLCYHGSMKESRTSWLELKVRFKENVFPELEEYRTHGIVEIIDITNKRKHVRNMYILEVLFTGRLHKKVGRPHLVFFQKVLTLLETVRPIKVRRVECNILNRFKDPSDNILACLQCVYSIMQRLLAIECTVTSQLVIEDDFTPEYASDEQGVPIIDYNYDQVLMDSIGNICTPSLYMEIRIDSERLHYLGRLTFVNAQRLKTCTFDLGQEPIGTPRDAIFMSMNDELQLDIVSNFLSDRNLGTAPLLERVTISGLELRYDQEVAHHTSLFKRREREMDILGRKSFLESKGITVLIENSRYSDFPLRYSEPLNLFVRRLRDPVSTILIFFAHNHVVNTNPSARNRLALAGRRSVPILPNELLRKLSFFLGYANPDQKKG
jgi:hypothetical protein